MPVLTSKAVEKKAVEGIATGEFSMLQRVSAVLLQAWAIPISFFLCLTHKQEMLE